MNTPQSHCPYTQFKNSSTSIFSSIIASFLIKVDNVLKKNPIVRNIEWIDLQKLPYAIRAEIIKKKLNIADIIKQDPLEILEEYSETLLGIFQTISQNIDIQSTAQKIQKIKNDDTYEIEIFISNLSSKNIFHNFSLNLQLYYIVFKLVEKETIDIPEKEKFSSWINIFRFERYMDQASYISQITTWWERVVYWHFWLILNELLSIYLAMSNRENAKKISFNCYDKVN